MAIFTFSTKDSNTEVTEAIKEIKLHCSQTGLTFSALVVRLLMEWHKKQKAKKVSTNGTK